MQEQPARNEPEVSPDRYQDVRIMLRSHLGREHDVTVDQPRTA